MTVIQYIRTRIFPLKPVQLLVRTGLKWQQDDCYSMAAALSYYALFSLFPLLLVILSIVGLLISPNTEAFQVIQGAVKQYLPVAVHDLVKETILALNQSSVGAGLIGFAVLVYSASTVFAILDGSIDKIWRTHRQILRPEPLRRTVLMYILNKLLAFLLVLGSALVLLASLISNIVIKAVLKLIQTFDGLLSFIQINEIQLNNTLQHSSALLILAIAACILFKILPSTHVAWGDVWLGGLLTAFLLEALQWLVSNSVISIGSQYLSYGVIGSVMILLLWIYFTFQIVLLGSEFSYIYAHLFGSRRHVSPADQHPVN